MSDKKERGQQPRADLEGLAKRFQDLWQDQLTAMAADPEFADMLGKWFAGAARGAGPAAPFPAMMPGMAGPFGPFDPTAWLGALNKADSRGSASGRDRTADDTDSAKAASAAKAGPASVAASSRSGGGAGDQLERRIADLEQRLERLEAALDSTGRDAPARRRKRRS